MNGKCPKESNKLFDILDLPKKYKKEQEVKIPNFIGAEVEKLQKLKDQQGPQKLKNQQGLSIHIKCKCNGYISFIEW